MLDKTTLFEIYRLHHLNWSVRKIARTLRISRKSVKMHPNPERISPKRHKRPGKLDAYHELIRQNLEEDPEVKVPVFRQSFWKKGSREASPLSGGICKRYGEM